MTPFQQALYRRVLGESLDEVARAGGVPSEAPLTDPTQPPAPQPAGPMVVPAGLEGSERAGFVGDWIQQRAAQLGGGSGPAPEPMPPQALAGTALAFPVPQRSTGPGDVGGVKRTPLTMRELAAANASPIATPEPRPALPPQRPSSLIEMSAAPAIGARRSPPPMMPIQVAGGGGFPSGGRAGGVMMDIFPGLFKEQRRAAMQEQAQQNRLAQMAQAESARAAARAEEYAAKAPGEAREAQRFAWDVQDRQDEQARARADADLKAQGLDPKSEASKRRRDAFMAAHPEFFRERFGGSPEVYTAIAAGDEKTWGMVEDAARGWEQRKGKPAKVAGGGAAPGGGGASGKGESEAIMLLAKGDVPGALAIADRIGGKGGQRIREKAAQIAAGTVKSEAVDARMEKKAGMEIDKANRRLAVGGWRRRPGAAEIGESEANQLRSTVAQFNALQKIANEMQQIDSQLTNKERLNGAAGIHSARTTRAMQLQGQAATALREIENTGVPSVAEMALALTKAPQLTSFDGWVNGSAKYRELLVPMRMRVESEMDSRGYERDTPRPRTVRNPNTGETEQANITDAAAAILTSKGLVVE